MGIQLSNLTSKQLDQLARLIAERPVVFLRDQKLSPQEQRKIGEYFGNVEIHPSAPHVPGLPGVQVIWTRSEAENIYNRRPGGTGFWHADISAYNPPGITHLHMVYCSTDLFSISILLVITNFGRIMSRTLVVILYGQAVMLPMRS